MNILIKEYDLTGTLYLNRIKAVCPLKWTNTKINILICNANKSDASTKVDKLKERAQINIEDSKAVSTKVNKY